MSNSLGFSLAIIINSNGSEAEVKGAVGSLTLTTAPLGVEMGTPFLVDTATQRVYPMARVKLMQR